MTDTTHPTTGRAARRVGRTDQPDLHEFISRFGSYAAVSAEGWAEWDRLNAEWRQNRRDQLRRDRVAP